MKMNRMGITRIVFIFDKFVVKIPNFFYQHDHFLQGCYANWSERRYCVGLKKYPSNERLPCATSVAPSYFCTWFGLLQIQAKCKPKLEDLTEDEVSFYEPLCGSDYKKENFGWFNDRLVCLDYP